MEKSKVVKQQEAIARTFRRSLKAINYSLDSEKKEISCGLFQFIEEVTARLHDFHQLKQDTKDINLEDIMLADKEVIVLWGMINRVWVDDNKRPYDEAKLIQWLLSVSLSVHPTWSEFIKRDLMGIIQLTPSEYRWIRQTRKEEIQRLAKKWREVYIDYQSKYFNSLKKASAPALTQAQRNSILGV